MTQKGRNLSVAPVKTSPCIALVAALLLFAAPTSVWSQPAGRVAAPPISTAVAVSCAGIPQTLRNAASCATALATSLQANQADIGTLAAAARLDDPASAKTILARHGMSTQQLEGATIVVRDETAGNAARIKSVSIEITCCPLTITIIIRF